MFKILSTFYWYNMYRYSFLGHGVLSMGYLSLTLLIRSLHKINNEKNMQTSNKMPVRKLTFFRH